MPSHPRGLLCVALAALAAACADGGPSETSLTPVDGAPERYIVVLKADGHPGPSSSVTRAGDDDASAPGEPFALRFATERGVREARAFSAVLDGFAAPLAPAQVAALRADPRVAYVEPDGPIHAYQSATQTSAPWGLDRIDQAALPLGGTYTYPSTAALVRVYVLDTGIRLTHTQFGGRATAGYDAVSPGGSASDCHGHGTHVAGTVGGSTYGVAKGVRLIAVRVLGCDGGGSTSYAIAGLDYVVQQKAANPTVAMVVNMSLGGGASTAMDDAVRRAVAAGVTVVVAAGNDATNACNQSPARVPEAITVAASDATDGQASFSNYGTCVDLYAPGVSIASASFSGDAAIVGMSGTSMASPHVAGAAALYLARYPDATPAAVATALTGGAAASRIRNPGTGTPNKLLQVGFIPAGAADERPDAAFTQTCSVLTCVFDASTSTDDHSIASYAWAWGDGLTGTGVRATKTFARSGTYRVRLTVRDGAAQTDTASAAVVLTNAAPVARFTSTCVKTTCTLNATSSTDDVKVLAWTWAFGDRTVGTGGTVTHAYPAPGTYPVSLVVRDGEGAVDTAQSNLVIPDAPPVARVAATCVRRECRFTATTSTDDYGVKAWRWDFGDETMGAGSAVSHTYPRDTTYTALLTVADGPGQTDTAAVRVTVRDLVPTPVITASCVRRTCSFSSGSSRDDGGIASYAWTFGDGGTSTLAGLTRTYAANGPFTVTLTVRDRAGQSATATTTVAALDRAPVARATATCRVRACTFVGTTSTDDGPGITYSWSVDGATIAGPTASRTFAADGTYTATLTVRDAVGQTATATATVTVVDRAPVPAFTLTCTRLVCSVDSRASTDDAGISSRSFNWGDGTAASTFAYGTHTFSAPGTYTITLTVRDANGGTATLAKTVTVKAI
ncbi:PKD domain-containing protein [Longimicrobium sp.]|uniref:PKD domain-containing protein n=1 Tax=Longimicrobium sp. TaxID=2029185 RepID=UPI002E320ECB|nr:PKD domain-containing protein [Longimicrobium sp.]HEX6042142.1 PKD domain-containing protein [Longimicrobium sp.]